jgi:hypothetical protein
VFGENSAFNIGRASGGEVDDEIKCFALIRRRFFRREYLRPIRHEQKEADSEG